MTKAAVSGVAVIVVLGAAYVGLSAYSGSVVHKHYTEALDKMQKEGALPPILKVTDSKYEQGLLSSTATLSLQLGCALPGAATPAPVVTLHGDIAHGPFPAFSSLGLARIDTSIALPPDAPAPLRAWLAGMKPGAIRTTIGFGGASSTSVDLPAGQFKQDDGQLQWKPMHARFQLDGARKNFSYDLDMPEVALDFSGDSGAGSFKLVNLRGQADGTVVEGMLMGSGTGAFTLDQAQVQTDSPGGKLLFNLNQLKYTTKSQEANDLLDASVALTGTADFKMGDKALKLDKIEVQESMKRLHAPTLRKLSLGFWQSLGGSLCAAGNSDLAETMEEQQAAMLAGMAQLLPYNPEYSVDKVAVSYEGKEGTLAYSVAANGMTAQDLQTPDRNNLLGKITAKASGKVPLAWLEKIAAESGKDRELSPQETQQQLDSAIDSLVKEGYIIREGDFISSSAQFEHGQLTINGKPQALPGLPMR